MDSVKLSKILEAVGTSATAFAGVFPPAALVGIGAGLLGNIITTLHQTGTPVVDENGQPVDLGKLSTAVIERFMVGVGLATEGSAIAEQEIAANPPGTP